MNRFSLVLLACLAASLPRAQTDPAAIVLTVNGDTIKAADYYRKMEYLPGVQKRVGSATLNYPPGFLTLEAIIHERLVFQLAKQKGVLASDAEIQAELTSMLAENPKLLVDAALIGQTEADVKHQLRYQISMFKLTTFGITLTDQEIDKFYKDNPTIFTIPKRAKLRVIAVTDEATRSKVDSELAAGKSFADIAKTYSEDVTKSNGGDFGTVPIATLPESIRNAVNKTKVGQMTEWVDMSPPSPPVKPGEEKPKDPPKTWAKFLLEDVIAQELTPLDAKLRKQIRRQLMVQRGQVKNDLTKEMAQLRASSKIVFANKTFADMYKRYENDYLRETGQLQSPPPK